MLHSIAPFFIVSDVRRSTAYYRDRLGFEITTLLPAEAPFFAIVARDGVVIHLKEIGEEVAPQPNATRHEWARWDAMVATDDPDALAEEFCGRGVAFHSELADTDDGLRAVSYTHLTCRRSARV